MRERQQLASRVAEAVFSLEEPYRSAILYRYFENQPRREIAARLDISVAAVESRLRRGLQQLRARLDREFGDRRSWCAALLPLAGQATTGAGAATGTTSASILTGALVMSTKIKIGIAVILVAAGVTYVSWPQGDEMRLPEIGNAEAGDTPGSVATKIAQRASVPDVSAESGVPEASSNTPSEPPVASPRTGASGPKAAPSLKWILKGEVKAAEVQLEGAVSIEIAGIRLGGRQGASMRSTCTFATPFAVDLTPVLAAHDDLLELEVRFDHPHYLPSTLRVNPSAAEGEPPASDRVIQMYVRLHRAAGVTGVVRSQSGCAVAGVDVAVFAARNERPEKRPIATTRSDAEGRYRLRVGTEGRYLVAAVDGGEHRPAFVIGTSALGRDTLMPDLVLVEGAAISGTIRVAGKPAPKAEAATSYPGAVPGQRLSMQNDRGTELVFVAGTLERATARADTDALGRYRIGGLGRVPYLVRPSRVSGLCSDVFNSFRVRREVVPPAENVDFDLAAVPVTIEVRAEGKPVGGAQILILAKRTGNSCSSSSSYSVGEDGRIRAALAARSDYELRVAADGFRRGQVRFTTGPANVPQTEIVDLVPRAEPGAVRLTVQTSDGAHPTELFLRLKRSGEPHETTNRRVEGDQGRFLIENLEPGLYRITAGHALSGGGSYYLEATIEASIKSGETSEQTMHLELGGRIRIEVRDREGRFVARTCRVVNQYGLPMKLWFRLVLPAGGGWGASNGATNPRGPVETYPPLPAGRYRVEFLADGKRVEKAIPVHVEAGKTTDVTWTRD
jgi:hypothetical protein